MMKVLAILLGLVSVAHAQAPVKQSGHVTPGHVPMWTTNGIIQDGGTAFQGFLSSIGVTAAGPGICQNSAPISGAYNQICLSVTTGSPSQLVIGNHGGAIAQPLQFVVNGVTYQFPFTGPGTGIIGPNTTIVGDPACWNSISGTALYDCGTATGTTTPRQLPDRFTDHINVKDFGAVCDGVTDDTTAFNAAAAYINNTFSNSVTATMEMVGVCLIHNITWGAFSPWRVLSINGTLLVSDPQGLDITQSVMVEGHGGGGDPQFSDTGRATIQSTAGPNATFTGTATGGGVEIIASSVTGAITQSGMITGTGVPPGTVITSQVSGTPAGAGTYRVNHAITSSSNAITQGPIVVHFSRASSGMKNIDVSAPTSGISIVADGIVSPWGFVAPCANINLDGVSTVTTSTGSLGLEIYGCQFFIGNNLDILGSGDGPAIGDTILIQFDANETAGNGPMEFDHLQMAGSGIEVNYSDNGGGQCAGQIAIKNWLYENMFNDPIILRRGACIQSWLIDTPVPADPSGSLGALVDGFIDNDNGAAITGFTCQQVIFINANFSPIPFVKQNLPSCNISILGGWGNNGHPLTMPAGFDVMYAQQGRAFDGSWLGKGAKFGPSATPLIPIPINQDPTTWGAGGSTLTTGKLAPDGTTNAAEVASAGGVVGPAFFPSNPPGDFAVGGWIISGVWEKCDGSTTQLTAQAHASLISGLFTNGTNLLNYGGDDANIANCRWTPLVGAGKIASYTPTSGMNVGLLVNTGEAEDFFMPWIIYAPPGTISDDEAVRLSRHLSTVVANAPQGTAGMRQPLFMDGVKFAGLPSSPAAGLIQPISDGAAGSCGDGTCTTFGTAITGGGGALKLLAWYNGSAWTLIGK